ncbi:MAG: response regulator [bacterium]|nr:response regulator [bacterium]
MITKNNPRAPILLVDDDEDWRVILREALQNVSAGESIYEVSSIHDALAFTSGEPPFENVPRPRLIYLDLEMPDGYGVELLEALKRDEATRDIPVVAMTTFDDEFQEEAIRKAGAVDFYIKPYDPDQVIAKIRKTAANRQPFKEPAQARIPG